MRRIFSLTLCVLSFGVAVVESAVPVLPQFPPLEFHPPKPERIVLDNGLVIYLLEDHELPLVQMTLVMPGGSQDEPGNKIALGELLGYTWTLGGTPTRTPESIEQLLERKAAGLGFSVGMESTQGSFHCRTQDFEEVFALFTDLLFHPALRKDKLDLARSQAQEGLRRINDEPEDVTRREFRGIMYGRAHPYARLSSPEILKKISREDLVAWHQTWIKPNGSILSVSGDFDSVAMKARLLKEWGAWAKGVIPTTLRPPLMEIKEPQLFYIQRPINQTQIRVGYPGLTRHHPDQYAWTVFNELWGSGGTSRLFQTVRTKMGLAYGVGSSAFSPSDQGFVVAVSQTRGGQSISAAKAILAINDEMRMATFTAKEVDAAKDAIINAYIQNFTSSAQIVSAVASNEFFGFPKDYIETYPAKIRAIQPTDVHRVADTYLVPNKATMLFVGDLSTFEKPLATLGKPREIRPIDYTSNESFY